jgi:hypothetical protein
VACLNRNDLKKIWETLSPRKVKISEDNCMVNIEDRLMIPLASSEGDEASSDNFLLITDNIEEHLKHSKFEYASGLFSLIDESKCTFPED